MKPTPFHIIAAQLGLKHTDQTLVHSAAIDSRRVCDGDLFFAIKGERSDGHDYLKQVHARGAVGAVVDLSYRGESYGLSLLAVPDVHEALRTLAQAHLAKMSSKVIGVTGSLGKTTTKTFLHTLLSSTYSVFASPLSYNSQLTLPLSILLAKGDEAFLILEMGMSEPLQIKRLIEVAPPDYALLTKVSLQHVDLFTDGLEGIAREKMSIFSSEKTELGIFPHTMPLVDEARRVGTCLKKTFSVESKEADYYLDLESVSMHIKGGEIVELPIKLSFKPNYENLAAAIALARELLVPWDTIHLALQVLTMPPMRYEKVHKKGVVFINDAYNANPEATEAALESIPLPEVGGKKIAVLSGMDALGPYTEGGHKQVARAALHHSDLLICLGEETKVMEVLWKEQEKEVYHFTEKKELFEKLKEVAVPGDVVLLKGARAHALNELLEDF